MYSQLHPVVISTAYAVTTLADAGLSNPAAEGVEAVTEDCKVK
jgi:hypothetical protein